MTPAPADKNQLQIRCPGCSQKFKVDPELMGRVVECGGCERHFEVTEDVIIRGGKIYPGERDKDALNHFQRVPGPTIGQAAATPVPRGRAADQPYYSPISKVPGWRIAFGWVGGLGIVAVCALLLRASPGTLLGDLPVQIQVIGALIVGLVGLAMIAFANPRTWRRTILMAGVFTAILLAMPFVFKTKQSSVDATGVRDAAEVPPVDRPLATPVTRAATGSLKERIGTAPLDAEIARMAAGGGKAHAYGVWLHDLSESYKLSVRDYILRAASAAPTIGIYSRDNGDYLLVMTGVEKSIEEIAAITGKFASTQQVHRELSVIEVKVDSSIFVPGPADKLTDRGSPAFYDLNKRELESIQLDRVSRAVKRLAEAEPKIYRDDITRQLVSLLGLEQVDFVGDVCKALLVWADNPEIAGAPGVARLKRLHADGKKIPREMVMLLAKAKAADAVPVVQDLWTKDPVTWEPLLAGFGQLVEPGLIAQLPNLEISTLHSAVRILGTTGTSKSIPVLETAKTGAGPELRVLIENAEKEIRSR